MRVLVNGGLAYGIWCLVVLGAGSGNLGVPALAAVCVIGLQIILHADWSNELLRILLLTLMGTALDTMLIHLGAYTPAGYSGTICPFWVSLLWANFGTTLNASLAWLQTRPALASVLGSVFGPMSYALADRWGAAEVHEPEVFHYFFLGIAWAAALPAVLAIARLRVWRVLRSGFLVLLFSSTVTATSYAAEVGGVVFPEVTEVHGVRLRLHGAGVLRYRVIFKGYAAALYLPEGTPGSKALDDVPKRLEIHYFWSIPAEAFREAANEILRRNLSQSQLLALEPRIGELHRAYEPVRPGDRYALTYIPHMGTELTLNGELKQRILGADFAAAYFSIWLGEHPIDLQLKQALLR